MYILQHIYMYTVHPILELRNSDPVVILEGYRKICLQGTPLYPRESVPTWQVSLHHRFLNMGKMGHRSEKMSPDHRLSSHRSALEDRLYCTGPQITGSWVRLQYMTGTLVIIHHTCLTTGFGNNGNVLIFRPPYCTLFRLNSSNQLSENELMFKKRFGIKNLVNIW